MSVTPSAPISKKAFSSIGTFLSDDILSKAKLRRSCSCCIVVIVVVVTAWSQHLLFYDFFSKNCKTNLSDEFYIDLDLVLHNCTIELRVRTSWEIQVDYNLFYFNSDDLAHSFNVAVT